MDIEAILIETDKILSVPEAWTQDNMAKDENNKPVDVSSEKATCFCLAGAILKAAFNLDIIPLDLIPTEQAAELEEEIIEKAGNILKKHIPTKFLQNRPHYGFLAFNDEKEATYEDIKDLLERTLTSFKEN